MWGVSVADMSVKKNATFAAHEAASFDVSQSLTICKQLLEHSWQSYNNEHYHLVWQEALDTAIEGCKGLLTMSTEKHVQELKQEAHMWFVLFLTFSGISLTAVAALVYLISTMRTFVSLRKCLVSSWESRESRPNPQSLQLKSLQSPLSTRPVIQNWANPGSPQQTPPSSTGPAHTPSQPQADPPVQHQVHYPTQSSSYPVATTSNSAQLCTGNSEAQVSDKVAERETDNDAEILAVSMKANLEERFREYQRSLWDLQRAIPGRTPGTPPGLYPTLSHLLPAHPVEGEP